MIRGTKFVAGAILAAVVVTAIVLTVSSRSQINGKSGVEPVPDVNFATPATSLSSPLNAERVTSDPALFSKAIQQYRVQCLDSISQTPTSNRQIRFTWAETPHVVTSDDQGCCYIELQQPAEANGSVVCSCSGYFPYTIDATKLRSESTNSIPLEPKCVITGELMPEGHNRSFAFGGAWNFVYKSVSRTELIDAEDLNQIQYSARAREDMLYLGEDLEARDFEGYLILEITGRRFTARSARYGTVCQFWLSVLNSRPFTFSCLVTDRTVDLGEVRVPAPRQILATVTDISEATLNHPVTLHCVRVSDLACLDPCTVRTCEAGVSSVRFDVFGAGDYMLSVPGYRIVAGEYVSISPSDRAVRTTVVVGERSIESPCVVVDREGRPINNATCYWSATDGRVTALRMSDEVGRLTIPFASSADEILTIASPGFSNAKYLATAGVPHEVTLQPAESVVVQLEDASGGRFKGGVAVLVAERADDVVDVEQSRLVWVNSGELACEATTDVESVFVFSAGLTPRRVYSRMSGWSTVPVRLQPVRRREIRLLESVPPLENYKAELEIGNQLRFVQYLSEEALRVRFTVREVNGSVFDHEYGTLESAEWLAGGGKCVPIDILRDQNGQAFLKLVPVKSQ